MAGPIGGNYTPAELNELQTIWTNLPDADSTTLKADIQKLTAMEKDHPDLQFIIIAINQSAGDPAALQQCDLAIAQELYPQLPNVVPPDMATAFSSLIKQFNANPYDYNPTSLTKYLQQLKVLLQQAQNIQPPSPQSSMIVGGIQEAINEVESCMGGMAGPGGLGNVANLFQFLLSPGAKAT